MFDNFRQLWEFQNDFILFQTKSMDLSGDFESLLSPLRQKLVAVAPRKVCEGMRFWRNLMHFDPFTKFSFLYKLCEEPQGRVFVVRGWEHVGTQNHREDP